MMEMVKPEISPLSFIDLPSIILNHARTQTTGRAASMDLSENGTNKSSLPVHSFKKNFKILMMSRK